MSLDYFFYLRSFKTIFKINCDDLLIVIYSYTYDIIAIKKSYVRFAYTIMMYTSSTTTSCPRVRNPKCDWVRKPTINQSTAPYVDADALKTTRYRKRDDHERFFRPKLKQDQCKHMNTCDERRTNSPDTTQYLWKIFIIINDWYMENQGKKILVHGPLSSRFIIINKWYMEFII